MEEKKQVIKFYGENETNELLDKQVKEALKIGPPERTPETQEYLVLLYYTGDDDREERGFEFITGRMQTYDFIKSIIKAIDVHKSLVLLEDIPYKDAASVYKFMKHISEKILEGEDTSFDIEDYNIGYSNEEIEE